MITKDNEQKTIYIALGLKYCALKGSSLHPCLTE